MGCGCQAAYKKATRRPPIQTYLKILDADLYTSNPLAIKRHFAVEEKEVFPSLSPEDRSRLLAAHDRIRGLIDQAGNRVTPQVLQELKAHEDDEKHVYQRLVAR
jgi:hypothetical protein